MKILHIRYLLTCFFLLFILFWVNSNCWVRGSGRWNNLTKYRSENYLRTILNHNVASLKGNLIADSLLGEVPFTIDEKIYNCLDIDWTRALNNPDIESASEKPIWIYSLFVELRNERIGWIKIISLIASKYNLEKIALNSYDDATINFVNSNIFVNRYYYLAKVLTNSYETFTITPFNENFYTLIRKFIHSSYNEYTDFFGYGKFNDASFLDRVKLSSSSKFHPANYSRSSNLCGNNYANNLNFTVGNTFILEDGSAQPFGSEGNFISSNNCMNSNTTMCGNRNYEPLERNHHLNHQTHSNKNIYKKIKFVFGTFIGIYILNSVNFLIKYYCNF